MSDNLPAPRLTNDKRANGKRPNGAPPAGTRSDGAHSAPIQGPSLAAVTDGTAEDDALLLNGLRARQPKAVAAFYARHQAGVHRLLLSELGPSHSLEDLTQDVFIQVLEGVGSVREPRSLRGWLRAVAVFTARAHMRRTGRRRRLAAVVLPQAAADQKQDPPCLDSRIALREVCRIIEDMPEREREVFLLRVLTGRNLSESAQECGVSVSTFKTWYARAQRRFLRQVSRRPSLLARLARDGGVPIPGILSW